MNEVAGYLNLVLTLFIFAISFNGIYKNPFRVKPVFKRLMPIFILFVSIEIICGILMMIASDSQSGRMSIILSQIIQTVLFSLCLVAGYSESVRANIPAAPFLRVCSQAKNTKHGKNHTEFTLEQLFFTFFIIIAGSMIIWIIFKPEITKEAKERLLKTGWEKAGVVFLVLSAAIFEEIVFRFFLMAKILRSSKNLLLAVLLSSLIWAFCHIGMVEPWWAKVLQIFYVGIILGYTRTRRGIEPAIILHIMMNLAFSAFLIFS